MIALLMKVTILLALGGMIAALLHRASAALRHLVWTLTLAGSLAIALATPIAPELPLSVAVPSLRGSEATEVISIPITSDPASGEVTGSTTPVGAATSITTIPAGLSIGRVAIVIWLLGALAVLARYLLGHLGLLLLQRRATPLSDPEWQELLSAVRAEYRITRPVRLLAARAVGSPVTWGTRPVVLLPDHATSWPFERRRVVLAHELAHAARGDYLAQLIACVACALYWFHPLVWLAARRLRSESERAADDLVLQRGIRPADYAAHLLDIATSARTLRLAGTAAIGMARPSHLEGRLLAVLDQSRSRLAPPARAHRAAWAGLLLLVLPLAALRPMPRAVPVTNLSPSPRGSEATVVVADSSPFSPFSPFSPEAGSGGVDSTFERTLPATPGEALMVDLESGGDVHVQGWDEPEVQVRARLGGLNWRDTRVELVHVRGGVRLHAWQDVKRSSSSTNHTFDIRVPRRFDVRISSGGGVLTIQDLEGEFRGSTGGGGFVIERARGMAELTTGGGDIRVNDVDMDGTVSTGGGMITLSRVRGGLRGSSGSGPVISTGAGAAATGNLEHVTVSQDKDRIHVGARATTREGEMLRVRKAGGAIVLDRAPYGADLETGGGEIRVGRSAGQVSASTGGGDITIGPVAGSVRAGTGAGNVHVTIAETRGDGQSVVISAGVGTVVLDLPPSFEGRFDLETAYTRSYGRRTRIQTDWDLREVETDDWDPTEGTPRKYVRASGRIGNGDGLVRIKIVNGDITIRRSAP